MKILRGIHAYADLGGVPGRALDHELSAPVVDAFMEQDTAAVGVDVHALVVQPRLSGLEFWSLGVNGS